MKAMSLRLRLILVILPPLLVVSVLLGIWRIDVAQRTTEELFDRSLLAAGLAIARDVAISEGDALSPSTRRFISDAGGGEVFYHVTGPGGIYVTGYAYPPRPDRRLPRDIPNYYMADYRGEPMRVLRMFETRTIDNLTGETVVTIWQRVSDRQAFARDLALRAAALIGGLMIALALVIWFGVNLGLRPLNDLQQAIRQRSPDDLASIRRPVPKEVRGVVFTLNRLLGQVRDSIAAHQAFISDAAHQLRNPASALLALAETLPDVSDPDQRRRHEAELIQAARASARLAEQLLSLERLRYDRNKPPERFDLNPRIEQICRRIGPVALARDLDFSMSTVDQPLIVTGDAVLIGEAITNLVENALRHGGSDMTAISVRASVQDDAAVIEVQDDGIGIPPELVETAFRRFSQLRNGEGSGLGLAIVEQVARKHGGMVRMVPTGQGTCMRLTFPLAQVH
ncbi:sensor histidine kinase [Paracoccus homiensis]|uniref:histidine kinase n=1 Tax=Paracoccus homiensis TaxID=364199 RepID=A0A1I0D703_9RHOB|nr:sensor histidine kinase [Paracoccus homiensis]SET27989.1 two-component system, OmpR family, sensor histidine kinase TctE [Paracoccus homiensis]